MTQSPPLASPTHSEVIESPKSSPPPETTIPAFSSLDVERDVRLLKKRAKEAEIAFSRGAGLEPFNVGKWPKEVFKLALHRMPPLCRLEWGAQGVWYYGDPDGPHEQVAALITQLVDRALAPTSRILWFTQRRSQRPRTRKTMPIIGSICRESCCSCNKHGLTSPSPPSPASAQFSTDHLPPTQNESLYCPSSCVYMRRVLKPFAVFLVEPIIHSLNMYIRKNDVQLIHPLFLPRTRATRVSLLFAELCLRLDHLLAKISLLIL